MREGGGVWRALDLQEVEKEGADAEGKRHCRYPDGPEPRAYSRSGHSAHDGAVNGERYAGPVQLRSWENGHTQQEWYSSIMFCDAYCW